MKKLGLLILALMQLSCAGQVVDKINGVSFVASREEVTQNHIDPVVAIHATHAAVMPFGFIRDLNSPEVVFNAERQWFGETKKGAKQYVALLHKNGISVMLKPQIWVSKGQFTGSITMANDEDWKILESSYENFIISYATLAQEAKIDMFCIGTELDLFVKNRPQFWTNLIQKVKEVYTGKLTYAANWDEYTRTPFWADLDFIGIDAYFPLSEERTPTIEQLKLGWQKWKKPIAELSKKEGKSVIFTEFGYRSMDFTGKKPWLVDRNEENVNLEGQAIATQAIFEEFWPEEWFAGGYIWKWFINHEKSGGVNDNRFTPQNKKAEEVIREHYKLN
ncbi:glycoside hydrolase TIM-barrel-like domain-containing protein [Aurantibacter crassamenti]|uniref:glycoside hydrolase family 113 n=1 Tax=Aurantibacter crassamenti TaxID=1837375 RepID=UPI00193990D6|nr:glycoside hydrolase TIM-barrel-like domain-containing protein [Aurantibacter crassamenti]MBM1104715.1 glycoside hydrolase TIM-barrel-like domain-containing protein [Aurantibacter crassamenti]